MSQMTRASISIAVAMAMVALLSSKVAAEEPPPQPARVEAGPGSTLVRVGFFGWRVAEVGGAAG